MTAFLLLLLLTGSPACAGKEDGPPAPVEERKPLRAEFSVADALAWGMAFERFETEVPPDQRAAALERMWDEARADGTETAFAGGAFAYLIKKAPDDPAWSPELFRRVQGLATNESAELRRVSVGYLGSRDDPESLRIVRAALEDEALEVRDGAVTQVYQDGDLDTLREWVAKHAGEPENAELLKRAQFLIDKGPLPPPTPESP